MANKFSKLNIRDTIVSGSGRVLKKLSTIFPLSMPTVSIDGDIFTITDTSGVATSFDILVGGVVITTITNDTFDLLTLGLTDGVYSISAVSKASGYLDSAQSNAIAYVKNIGNYIAFSSPSSFTLRVVDKTKYWDGVLEYSADTRTWNEWDGTTTLSADNGVLYMRGTGNTKITAAIHYLRARWVLTGGKISCVGNIENLLDYTAVANGEHPTMADYCYSYMFHGCTSLTTAPELPATTLAMRCYYYMFAGCTNLTTAPKLPATNLAYGCYESMFSACVSLTTAPELSATTLASGCYRDMFRNCTALTTAPELSATTLASGCYEYMFYGCSYLTTAPALSATTLDWDCYAHMFESCTRLTTVPALPATTLANHCYSHMFYDCRSIKLSAEQIGEYTIAYRIPTSGEGVIPGAATGALTDMFTGIVGTFTGTPEINTTYYLHSSNSVV